MLCCFDGQLLDSEPAAFEDASKHQCWRDAMTEEYDSILKNDVWDIIPRPEGKSIVTSKWIYKIKHAAHRSVEKCKARFLARGFFKKEGIDYDETFAPVAHFTSIHMIMLLQQLWDGSYIKWT